MRMNQSLRPWSCLGNAGLQNSLDLADLSVLMTLWMELMSTGNPFELSHFLPLLCWLEFCDDPFSFLPVACSFNPQLLFYSRPSLNSARGFPENHGFVEFAVVAIRDCGHMMRPNQGPIFSFSSQLCLETMILDSYLSGFQWIFPRDVQANLWPSLEPPSIATAQTCQQKQVTSFHESCMNTWIWIQ